MRALLAVLLAVGLTGCGTLVPKKVEFFQDKVKQYPEYSDYSRQLEKQLAQRLQQKTAQTVEAALETKASTNVVIPAKEAERLAIANAVVVGPPEKPATIPSEALAVKVESTVGKLDSKVDDFKKGNNENEGKKIEGTGFFQVSYFAWVGGILAVIALVYFAGKIALNAAAMVNPGAAVGLNVVNGLGAVAGKGFSQLIKGGENFKKWVTTEVKDADIQKKVLDAFRAAQERAQDSDVQNAVIAVTK
jgi:hypothetical protein